MSMIGESALETNTSLCSVTGSCITHLTVSALNNLFPSQGAISTHIQSHSAASTYAPFSSAPKTRIPSQGASMTSHYTQGPLSIGPFTQSVQGTCKYHSELRAFVQHSSASNTHAKQIHVLDMDVTQNNPIQTEYIDTFHTSSDKLAPLSTVLKEHQCYYTEEEDFIMDYDEEMFDVAFVDVTVDKKKEDLTQALELIIGQKKV
ncbi:unnamed protein product [Mytilus coruscus]|uniref:Uncharacterized protein n=1 Tax=Mytilus coruscus TaxID=42192 RepID=A0A6J8BJM1_MYTCO|nr:unnamed protein product [Mytilus coruscus]